MQAGLIRRALPILFFVCRSASAQESSWDTTQPRGKTREIDFETSEGTWMSVDVSPDGRYLVFDLLAHIYRVPAEGGRAECLTQDSGVAENFHPRYSPDGKTIAFVSDRKGQNNLWIMNPDGTSPRPVFIDKDVRVVEPAWTPDSQFVVVRRQRLATPGQPPSGGIWMYHKDGGDGIELIGRDVRGAQWPSVSRDGASVYFHNTEGNEEYAGHNDFLQGAFQLKRLELKTGDVMEVTAGETQQQYQGSSGGAVSPEVSPDGRYLAFARRIPDGTVSFKGKKLGPRTALWLRDLKTGSERVLLDPIEVDVAEGGKVLRVLPGYAWTPDGKSIVISQGGKLRRVDASSGAVTTIPFTARVHRTISEMAYAPVELLDGPLEVRFARWPAVSPGGRELVFQAVGKIWIQDFPAGTPRRLTPASFTPLELSPTWSPDGQWVAFTSWDDRDGHLWKIRPGGGDPVRLTTEPGEYIHPVFTPNGMHVVLARGSGATARGRSWSNNLWYELVKVPSAGGAPEFIFRAHRPFNAGRPLMPRRQVVQPTFGPDDRLFFADQKSVKKDGRDEEVTELVSVKLDGTDKRVHITFPYADHAAPSPDGKWVAFEEGDNVYLTALPWLGTGSTPPSLDKRKGKLPVKSVSREGGNFPRWRDATTLDFGSARRVFSYDVTSEKTTAAEIRLSVPRARGRGTLALVGARIVTLNQRRVIPTGTLVVKDGRIACVGTCSTAGVSRTIDVKGKTIIPGFIDMHAHHHRDHSGVLPRHNWESAVYLAYGVTTTLDNSMWSANVFSAAELIEAGEMAGPRTFSTGDPLYAGDGDRQNDITSYQVAEDNVNRLASYGAVTIKSYQQPRRDQRQWIVDVARKKGLKVTGEGGDLEYNLGLIMDGQTGWEHPLSYTPLYADAARFFGTANAVYSATFVVGGPGPWNEEYFWQESEIWKDPKQQKFLPWRMLIPHTRRRILRPETDYSFPMLAQGMSDIVAAGGYGTIGAHGQHHGLGSHWEVWMAAAGLGPMGALEVASLHGAHSLGMEKHLGSIDVGKLADLIVLNSNPLDDIRNTEHIQYVVKDGVVYDAATLDQVWPEQKAYGDYPWVNRDALRSDDRPLDAGGKVTRK